MRSSVNKTNVNTLVNSSMRTAIKKFEKDVMTEYNAVLETLTEEQKAEKLTEANTKAKAKYDEVSTSFLWIKNIWLADSTVNPIMNYSDFIKKSTLKSDQISESEYNLVIYI